MKTVTILSGKGGVGKSSIIASIAVTMSKNQKIICADCDVDASNLALVLGVSTFEEWNDISTNIQAVFDLEKCKSCKKCFHTCYFNAINWVNNKPQLKNFSCEGCGACKLVCPENAISFEKIYNAKIGYANTPFNFRVVSAQLKYGETGSGKVVSEFKKKAKSLRDKAEIMIVDSAAGIGCPVIASVTGSDYAIIVTEPTPSGFSDMKKALEVVQHFRIPTSIIINKHDINPSLSAKIEIFAKEKNLEIMAKIPFDKQFAKALVKMVPIVELETQYEQLFNSINKKILEKLKR